MWNSNCEEKEEKNDVPHFKKCRFVWLLVSTFSWKRVCHIFVGLNFGSIENSLELIMPVRRLEQNLTAMSCKSMKKWPRCPPFRGKLWFWLEPRESGGEVWRTDLSLWTLCDMEPLYPVSMCNRQPMSLPDAVCGKMGGADKINYNLLNSHHFSKSNVSSETQLQSTLY